MSSGSMLSLTKLVDTEISPEKLEQIVQSINSEYLFISKTFEEIVKSESNRYYISSKHIYDLAESKVYEIICERNFLSDFRELRDYWYLETSRKNCMEISDITINDLIQVTEYLTGTTYSKKIERFLNQDFIQELRCYSSDYMCWLHDSKEYEEYENSFYLKDINTMLKFYNLISTFMEDNTYKMFYYVW